MRMVRSRSIHASNQRVKTRGHQWTYRSKIPMLVEQSMPHAAYHRLSETKFFLFTLIAELTLTISFATGWRTTSILFLPRTSTYAPFRSQRRGFPIPSGRKHPARATTAMNTTACHHTKARRRKDTIKTNAVNQFARTPSDFLFSSNYLAP